MSHWLALKLKVSEHRHANKVHRCGLGDARNQPVLFR
jgi:hypothetical protein